MLITKRNSLVLVMILLDFISSTMSYLGIVNIDGQLLESHLVITEDGYILEMHRLINDPQKSYESSILMLHGLTASSRSFLMLGPESLPVLLHEKGVDVWLGNYRGNIFSNRHINLDLPQSQFWNFSFHEIGMYDLPAKIDYILKINDQKPLSVFAYSETGIAMLALLSEQPEYNQKLEKIFLLAPSTFFEPVSASVKAFTRTITFYYKRTNKFKLSPRRIFERLCSKDGKFCDIAFQILAGNKNYDDYVLRPSAVSGFVSEHASVKQLMHIQQLMNSLKFRKYDYGKRNLEFYGTQFPPEYDLTRVTIPTYVIYGSADTIISPKQMTQLILKLPNANQNIIVTGYGHADFLSKKTAKDDLYEEILELLQIRA